MPIIRKARLPLYAQIKQQLEQELVAKKLSPGQRLPSEEELSAQFGASRMTVRRAIDQLVSQGRLRRVQGHGTFVAEQPLPTARGLTRWSFELISQTDGVRKQVTRVEQVPPTFRVSNALRTMPTEPIVQVTIELTCNGQPLGCSIARIPRLLLPDIGEWQLESVSLTQFLTLRAGLQFGRVEERVRAVPAEEDEADMLKIEPGTPLLYVDSLIFLACGIPVILADTFYRGEHYVYHGLLRPLDRQP